MPSQKRAITAEDLYKFELISDVRFSPDGEHIVYTVQRVDSKTEKKYSNLWMAKTGDGESGKAGRARQFTRGDQKDSKPRWSPEN